MEQGGVVMPESIRVFLVDNHAILRMVLADMLRREPGIHVVGSAASAAEALDALAAESVDVPLTDLRMPDMSGDALIAEVRRRASASASAF